MKPDDFALPGGVALRTSWTRLLLGLSLVWGVLLFWLAPHPPMIDLPQHAAQVSLLKDFVLDRSPWREEFRINPLTPYLIGYGLALPLSFVMPVAAALKVLLSLAYVAFVALCVKLREHFGADPRLDWLFVVSFFGFAYKWGFMTFLVAAPLGLWFIWLADRYAAQPEERRGLGLVGVGILLLSAHGLIFFFGISVGVALLAGRTPAIRDLLRGLRPYAILVLIGAAYLLINRQFSAGMEHGLTSPARWGAGLLRIPKAIGYTVLAGPEEHPVLLPAAAAIALLCIPWLLGLRIDWQRRASWIPFATLFAILTLGPSATTDASALYQRFALFLFPTYAWMFTRRKTVPAARRSTAGALPLALLILACWLILSLHTVRTLRFAKESADIDAILGNLEPRQRALGLVFDPASNADHRTSVYLHYPAWYQAEKQGLVDFNFAWYPPQVVRFRVDRLPAVAPGFAWRPDSFDWVKHRGDDYRYFIIRHSKKVPEGLFKGAACPPRLVAAQGNWMAFERCAVSSAGGL